MPLTIYNSASGKKEIFEPLDPPKVKFYVCGITAYDETHLGHARAAVVFDVVYRVLKEEGYQVTYVRNFTDIDDKILKRAQESGEDWKVLAQRYMDSYEELMEKLKVLKPDQEPRATQYIEPMHALIKKLEEKELAYPQSGDVFFAVRKFPTYGSLAKKNLSDLEAGARVEVREDKRDPLDFALWKKAKEGEPYWESPWGRGRPGWHIECSAMATSLLGESLDIHGGGRDLIFPHHENERAQSEGATGKPFVRYWMHNGFVQLGEDKMSKSTGNFLTLRDILEQCPAEALRHLLLSSHYRRPLEFTQDLLKESRQALRRVYETLERWQNFKGKKKSGAQEDFVAKVKAASQDFILALEEDFNTAKAMALSFDLIRELNRWMDEGPSPDLVERVQIPLKEFFELNERCLGIFGTEPEEYLKIDSALGLKELEITELEINQKIKERTQARKDRDFAKADAIRDSLLESGITLKDNLDGSTVWSLR